MNLPCIESVEEPQWSPLVYEKSLENEAKELRQEINVQLRNFIHPVEGDEKSHYRNYNLQFRQASLDKHKEWLEKNWQKYERFFALPSEINPKLITPRLELIEKQSQRNIFRISR